MEATSHALRSKPHDVTLVNFLQLKTYCGELKHRTEKRVLSYPNLYVESDSANNSYQWKSPFKSMKKWPGEYPPKVAKQPGY